MEARAVAYSLHTEPYDTDNASDEDEEERPPHAHDRAAEHGKPEMVLNTGSSHGHDHESRDQATENTRNKGLLPCHAGGNQGSRRVPSCGAKRSGEPEHGESVPG